jgi:hypothetical protein
MKRFRESDFWFELTQAPHPSTGRPVRYVRLTCRQCKSTVQTHANKMADDKLRKYFMRRNWHVGKTIQSHLCEQCQKTQLAEAPPAAAASSKNPLFDYWLAATQQDRRELLLMISSNDTLRHQMTALLKEVGMIHDDWLLDALITSTYNDNVVKFPEPAPAPAGEQHDDDNAPADWWLEIHGTKGG